MALVVDLLKPSPLMASIMNQLNVFRVSYEGGTQFKRMVLIKRPTESPQLYQDKLNNVSSLPICKSMITELLDIIFDEEPTRELAFLNQINQPIATPLWFEDFLENSDLQDNEFSDFMEKAAEVAAVEGWSWVFVDLPEEASRNNRPYVTLIPAQHVIDWKVFNEDGISIITYLKVIEYQDDQTKRIKVWVRGTPGGIDDDGHVIPETPTTATIYVVPTIGATAKVAVIDPEEIYTFPSNYPIPVIQIMPIRDIQNSNIGVSDLTDIADMQREWLRLESEAYDSIRFSKPIVRADPSVKVPAGGGGIVRGAKDCMEVFEIPVLDVQQIREQQKQLLASFDAYTGRAGSRVVAESIQSGISIVEERKALHKRAQTRARQLEKAEENILSLVCFMMGITWAGDVEYNSDYESRDTQFRIALLTQAKALSPNLLVQKLIDNEVIRMIAPPDEVTKYLQLIGEIKEDINTIKITDDDYRPGIKDAADTRGHPPILGSISSDALQKQGEYAALANMNAGITGSL